MTRLVKVAITGAAGQIGYALVFRIASGQMFGPNVKVELRLLELPQAFSSLQGVAMELEDAAFPLLTNVVITTDVNEAMKDANWVVLVGAVPRKEGMERADLLKINGTIFKEQGKAINNNAAADVRVFVVGNPCNTNCLITMHSAPDVPRDRFYAMTSLDANRAKMQLAIKAGASVTEVTKMTIWGNHSANQFPDYFHALIGGKPVIDILDGHWLKEEFIPMIQQRGAAVIKARGASSAASAANAAVVGVNQIVTPTVKDDWFSVAKCSKGEYGVDPGLVFSFPTRCNEQGQISVVENLSFNDFAKQKFAIVLDELRQEYAAVKALGFVKD